MSDRVDLDQLLRRENEQAEWKRGVADVDDVLKCLCAFANDLNNLGGGYVVWGAEESRDPFRFPQVIRTGLESARLRDLEGRVLTACRERVDPPIAPLLDEIPTHDPARRILVFTQPATRHAHTLRSRDDTGKYYVRSGSSTIEARSGLMRELLVRKGALEPWDHRACDGATSADLDLLAVRECLNRARLLDPDQGLEPFLSADRSLSPFMPPLFRREPLTGALRPRNFAMLLFGREPTRWIPGAAVLFSRYDGPDRSEPFAERHEIAGNLLVQMDRLSALLAAEAVTFFDKRDTESPNGVRYPVRALYEAMGNALVHRDYERMEPTRFTALEDRLEVASPGGLPLGVDSESFRTGRAGARWRNQALAWILSRLQRVQAEGQGIPTILRTLAESGCPPPLLEDDATRVRCVLPANPAYVSLNRASKLAAGSPDARAMPQPGSA